MEGLPSFTLRMLLNRIWVNSIIASRREKWVCQGDNRWVWEERGDLPYRSQRNSSENGDSAEAIWFTGCRTEQG